jgi:hypothetical protein
MNECLGYMCLADRLIYLCFHLGRTGGCQLRQRAVDLLQRFFEMRCCCKVRRLITRDRTKAVNRVFNMKFVRGKGLGEEMIFLPRNEIIDFANTDLSEPEI